MKKLFNNLLDQIPLSKIPYGLIGLILFCLVILAVSLRGFAGNPNANDLNTTRWKENGPFELSPERGRFALTYSLVEDQSVFFSIPVARFATPDLGYWNNNFVSLFAPFLSFLVIPGYIIGKFFGASQIGAFGVISIFAVFNFFLIRAIAIRLGANHVASTLGAVVFLFATPAFSYAVILYQHHVSTFLILLSIYVLLKSNSTWSYALIFFLCAFAVPLDYPNLFLMFPIAVYALGKIVSLKKIKNKLSTKINIYKTATVLIMIFPISFFFLLNYLSYGNPLKLAGTVPYIAGLDAKGKPVTVRGGEAISLEDLASAHERSFLSFFNTRNILNGFYIQFLSPDRGIIYYSPVVIFGIIGIALAVKKKIKMSTLLVSVIGVNFLLYGMWGDPWGGWAFGSRYLIPSYAILSIFIALLLTYWRKKYWFFVVFILVTFYSIAINALGAITTSAIPPQVQVLELEKISGIVQRYTFQRNWEFLLNGNSKSFVYQTFMKERISALQFYQIITISIFILVGGIIAYYIIIFRKQGGKND